VPQQRQTRLPAGRIFKINSLRLEAKFDGLIITIPSFSRRFKDWEGNLAKSVHDPKRLYFSLTSVPPQSIMV
jgi:hypothetical protein